MDAMNMELIVADMILPYLSPVSFVRIIEASKYLYKKHQSKIQEKRKESLTRFVKDKPEGAIGDWMYSRYTKLPSGRIEGKYETLTDMYYYVFSYLDGERMEDYFVYNHRRYKDKRVSEEDMVVLEKILVGQFGDWEDVDVSRMQLLSDTYDSTGSSDEK